ncbi:MAG: penicillin acylase family protein [Planctomycetota bacterium]
MCDDSGAEGVEVKRRRSFRGVFLRVLALGLGVVGLGAVLASCATRPPALGSIDGVARLDGLDRAWPGLDGEVEIVWDEHLIPFITAGSDADAAYAMGLVHAHLRLAQMELFRRVSQGRFSEMGGPLVVGLDHAIRAIDLDRAVPEMEAALPDETRLWIERYVAGVNAYRETMTERPTDATTLGFDYDEPWTVADVLTFGRLASVDVNWGRFITLARLEGQAGYDDFIQRLWAFGDAGVPSFGGESRHELDALADIGRTGSNAFVVSGERSASGGALVASDPHLGLPMPNIWCVLGYRTPERAVVGFTIPALPFVVVGRNEGIAWTGTNMQSSSTVLYRLPEGWTPESTREESIGVRWWFDATESVRESALGPVLTDAAFLGMLKGAGDDDVAIRWRGHDVSDESSAFLNASKSVDWEGFREAFRPYAAGGQNMLFGDSDGNIGQIMAVEAVPAAAAASRVGVVDAGDPAFAWGPGIASPDLPFELNPEAGFLVSANNVPTPTSPPLVPQGNSNDRVVRMSELLSEDRTYTLDELLEIQKDVFSAASQRLAGALHAAAGSASFDGRAIDLMNELGAWDGRYARDSVGAAAYQAALDSLIDVLYEERYGPRILTTLRSAPYVHDFAFEDLTDDGAIAAIRSAAKGWDPGMAWGDVHRLRLSHPIGAVPLLGGSYRFEDRAYEGSTTTVFKAAHRVTGGTHATTFGANARLLCDMGTLDDNRVVILGGQDGWMGSDRLLDQVPVWLEGRTIPLPLSEEGQAARAVRTTTLRSATN